MDFFKKIIWKILNTLKIGGPIQLLINSQVKDAGWFNSFYSKESVDKNNNPLPWYSYSFISFVKPRLKKEFSVFEYGCGNSTLWFSNLVGSVKAVEHHRGWYEKISGVLPKNAELLYYTSENNAYAKSAAGTGKKYDIIIIDGIDRNECVYQSVSSLTERGIIIYDNSDRAEYTESMNFLTGKGFKRINFWGLGPVTPINTCTSVFYRENNCLEI